MSRNSLNISRSLSGSMAFWCWLFIFVIPAVLMYLALNWIFGITFSTNLISASPRLMNEMRLFKEDATTNSFLQRTLSGYFAENATLLKSLDAEKVRQKIQNDLGFSIDCLAMHGSDSADVETSLSVHARKFLRFFPVRMTHKLFVAINNQHNCDFLNKGNRESYNRLVQNDSPAKLLSDSETFLQNFFALAAIMPIQAGKVSESISGKLRGPVYFYYQPQYESKHGKAYVVSGYLLVIPARSISMRRILEAALINNDAGLERGYAVAEEPVPTRFDMPVVPRTVFIRATDSYALTSTPLPETVVDLVQRGTLYPFKLDETAERMPLLKVSLPNSFLQHPLSPWQPVFNLIMRVFISVGAILLLYLHFFGLEFKAGIRLKIMFGIMIILLVPSILLAVAYTSWLEFTAIETRYLVESRQHMALERVQQGLSDYLSRVQTSVQNYAAHLSDDIFSKNFAAIEEKTRIVLKNLSAFNVYFEIRGSGSHEIGQKVAHGIETSEDSLLKFMARSMLNAFNIDGSYSLDDVSGFGPNATAVRPDFLSDVYSSYGRLQEYQRYNTGNRFSVFPISKDRGNAPEAMVVMRFSQEDLLRDYLGLPSMNNLYEAFPEQNIDHYIARKAGLETEFFDIQKQSVVEDSRLIEKLRFAALGESFSFIGAEGKICRAGALVDYPLVSIVSEKNPLKKVSAAGAFLVFGLYILLIFVFIGLLFRQIYLIPLNEFTLLTGKIGDGDFNAVAQIEENDEFKTLNSAFSQMAAGLAEKELMARFVSSDVVEAVDKNSESQLQPGGEKVEATVVFVQVGRLKNLTRPREILSLLSSFIELAEVETGRFGGVMDKVIEDTLMLVFRSNQLFENHAISASMVALRLARQMPDDDIRCGIASGSVVSGRIGSRTGKLDYTVIGDTVNLAARLKAEARRASSTSLIIAPSSIRKLHGLARVQYIDKVSIKGKARQYPIYELVGLRSETHTT